MNPFMPLKKAPAAPAIQPVFENLGIPRPIFSVKTYRATVKMGDTVGTIAKRYTGDGDRYGELVAANASVIRLGPIPSGRSVATPVALRPGDRLLIPAHWPDLGHAEGEAPKAAMLDLRRVFAGALESFFYMQGTAGAPPSSWQDIATVLMSWWPYLVNQPGAPAMPSLGAVTSSTSDDVRSYLTKLIISASSFLATTKCPASVAAQIPWAAVPWDKVPWEQIQTEFGSQTSEFWTMLRRAGAPATPLPAAVRYVPKRPEIRTGALGSVPEYQAGELFVRRGTTPSFVETDWSSPDYQQVDWSSIPWGSIFWSIFADGKVRDCASANPGRLRELWNCRDCFEGQGQDKFKEYLCTPTLDPCLCDNVKTPSAPAVKPEVELNKGVPAVPSTLPKWDCTPFPDCLSKPENWPANVTAPCIPFPGCIPSWITSQGGNPPKQLPTAPAEEPKKPSIISKSINYWLVAAAAVAAFFTGLVTLSASRS